MPTTLRRAFAIAIVLALALPLSALADNISNTLDATVDSTLEVMGLTVGGGDVSTTLFVLTTNGDGKQGCNLTGSTTLVVSLASSDESIATVSPTTITFGSCGDTPSVTVSPVAAGDATISLALVSNSTAGSFDLAPASFTAHVNPAVSTDTIAPDVTITLAPTAPDGLNEWYRSDVTATIDATDASGIASIEYRLDRGASWLDYTAPIVFSTDSDYTIDARATDGSSNHNVGTATRASFALDETAPTVDYTSAVGTSGSNGWYTSAVTATFTATDNLSGFDAVRTLTTTGTSTTSGEGASVTVGSPAFTDYAGNSVATDAATSDPFKIDLTDPTVAITAPVLGLSTIAASLTVSGTASDTPSGIGPVSVNGVAATVGAGAFSASGVSLDCGANTILATATDLAGRSKTDSISVTRICFSGLQYYQPLDQTTGTPVINAGRYGRVIPTKVTLSILGGDTLTDAVAAANGWSILIGVNAVACSGGSATDAVEAYADAGSSNAGTNLFRWDSVAQQWLYNLDTKAPAGVTMTIGSCYRLDVYVSDGSNKVKVSDTTYAIFKPTK